MRKLSTSAARCVHRLLACGLIAAVSIAAADKVVSFSADIQPILESSCWKCHGGSIQLSKLDLSTREAALEGGAKGTAIVPGKAGESKAYRLVAGLESSSTLLDGKCISDQISI